MNYVPCRDRRFLLKLGELNARVYGSYAFWLKHLVQRLGAAATRQIWNAAFQNYDCEFLQEILGSGWQEVRGSGSQEAPTSPAIEPSGTLGPGADSMKGPDAHSMIRATPPLPQIRVRFPDVRVERQTSTYETLHLSLHGLALISETLIARYGKQGELIAYDALHAQRSAMGQRMGGSVADFIRFVDRESETPDMFSAGLEIERVKVSPSEHLTLVKECEWARYFRERHPGVGYLVACSTDEAFARGFHESLRLKRTSTLMEGGSLCDFRYYCVDMVIDEAHRDK
jgi:hypothetical protein